VKVRGYINVPASIEKPAKRTILNEAIFAIKVQARYKPTTKTKVLSQAFEIFFELSFIFSLKYISPYINF
jgi:hypothetical protein